MESRTQGSRPRTQKKSEAKAKNSLSEDRHSRGQGQECSRPRPRTHAQVLSKKKKGPHKSFLGDLQKKKVFAKNFSSAPQNFNNLKNTAVLEPRTGQFSRTWSLKAKAKDLTFEAKTKAKDFKMCPRGQRRPRGLHLSFKVWLLAAPFEGDPSFFYSQILSNFIFCLCCLSWKLHVSSLKG